MHQTPRGADSHVHLVVAAEEVTNLERATVGVCKLIVEAHFLETLLVEQVFLTVG